MFASVWHSQLRFNASFDKIFLLSMKTNHMSNSAIGKQRILHWKDWKFIIHYSSFSNNSTKAVIVFKLYGVLCQGLFSNRSCNTGRSVLWDVIFYFGGDSFLF